MKSDRKSTRHDLEFEVRFSSATEFVSEYAENLSVGGLFVRNAQHLAALTEVSVQIDLPGLGAFTVKARVAHVMDEAMAALYKRHPGAGLQLIDTPAGFQDALMGYLGRLGRRRDALVLVEDPGCLGMLDSAGFRTEATTAGQVVEQTSRAKVVAIVANKISAQSFREALTARVPVIGCDYLRDEESLLVELDRLLSSTS